MLTPVLLILLLLVLIALAFLFMRQRKLTVAYKTLSQEYNRLTDRVRGIIDAEAEKQRVLSELDARRQQLLKELDTLRQQETAEIAATKQRELGALEAERARLQQDIITLQANQKQAIQELEERRRAGQAEKFNLELSLSKLREDLKALEELIELQSFGFYKPRYNFENSARYQTGLEQIREQQKRMIKDKTAAIGLVEWTVDGSRAEGRKQINQTLKLIIRAFNGESDAAIAKVKYNNITVMETRIRKAYDAIINLVAVQQCRITPEYLDLKLQELYLVHEYQEKVQEEKEEQRRIREEMREEEIAQRELEKAKQDAEREERRYEESLRKAREEVALAVGAKQQKLLGQIETLQRMLDEAHANKERAIARAQMTRSGHVYIISNVGSFGEHVYKIGMTRRLDPMDRVRELGDASVPFHFDVHAIIYSEDAPTLETKLHRLFHHRRINRINERKEFFRVTIEEIAEAVQKNHGEIDIILAAEAVEYRKTLALLQEGGVTSATDPLPRAFVRESSVLDI